MRATIWDHLIKTSIPKEENKTKEIKKKKLGEEPIHLTDKRLAPLDGKDSIYASKTKSQYLVESKR